MSNYEITDYIIVKWRIHYIHCVFPIKEYFLAYLSIWNYQANLQWLVFYMLYWLLHIAHFMHDTL